MGISYVNLDENTRRFMLEELEEDARNGRVYISNRLNELGQSQWIELLREAIRMHNDDWLAEQLRNRGYMNSFEIRRTRRGEARVSVPRTAPEILAEGEFNRYYVRGVCRRAIDEGINIVIVYRGKQVRQPRPESENIIGNEIDAQQLLEDLRVSPGVEPALGIARPNSGLTVRLP